MRILQNLAAILLLLSSVAALAQPAPPVYAVADTDLGTMLDDPAAKAVLMKYIPELVQNPAIDQARPMTLTMLKQFKPELLTDKTLADIDADLAKLHSGK